jgi:hypothetical protein
LIVSKQVNALTAEGEIVIYSETNSIPELVPISDLPRNWDKLTMPSGELISVQVAQDEVNYVASDPTDPKNIVQHIEYAVFLPSEDSLASFSTQLDSTATFYRPDLTYSFLPHAFDIYQSATSGLGVQVIYYSSRPTANPRAVSVIQAPSDEIESLLRQSVPIWQQSRPATVLIGGREREAWIVTGGLLREEGDDPLIGAIINVERTLIYVEVQNADAAELNLVIAGLEQVNLP